MAWDNLFSITIEEEKKNLTLKSQLNAFLFSTFIYNCNPFHTIYKFLFL